MKMIQYHGPKPLKRDNVASTGLTWTPGQIHHVVDETARKLLAYSSIWREVSPDEETHAETQAEAWVGKTPSVLKMRPLKAA